MHLIASSPQSRNRSGSKGRQIGQMTGLSDKQVQNIQRNRELSHEKSRIKDKHVATIVFSYLTSKNQSPQREELAENFISETLVNRKEEGSIHEIEENRCR